MKKLGRVVASVRLSLGICFAFAGCDVGSTANLGTGTTSGSSGDPVTSGVSSGSGATTTSSTTTPITCAGSTGVSAPNGYHVVGNLICDASNNPHLFHGVARPSLEWSDTGEHISASDFQLMHDSWNANVVRVAMNENFWLSDQNGYQATIANVVQWAHQASLDVILDLHWSGPPPGQQEEMADQSSITFWSQVASTYKGDGRVLFELYNEPNTITWNVWLNGDGNYAGMQQLYGAIRAAGADNVVIAGGLDWAYDLTGVTQGHALSGTNIAYATHPYSKSPEKAPDMWDAYWGNIAAQYPVFVTEFGTLDCTTAYYSDLMTYADQHNASWTAWAWYVSGCSFPSIVNDWSGTPNAPGAVVQAQLKSYP